MKDFVDDKIYFSGLKLFSSLRILVGKNIFCFLKPQVEKIRGIGYNIFG